MTKFDELADRAVENYGIVTSAEATAMGIALKDVKEWVDNGRLEKVGRIRFLRKSTRFSHRRKRCGRCCCF